MTAQDGGGEEAVRRSHGFTWAFGNSAIALAEAFHAAGRIPVEQTNPIGEKYKDVLNYLAECAYFILTISTWVHPFG
jgi:hypothetical protein